MVHVIRAEIPPRLFAKRFFFRLQVVPLSSVKLQAHNFQAEYIRQDHQHHRKRKEDP